MTSSNVSSNVSSSSGSRRLSLAVAHYLLPVVVHTTLNESGHIFDAVSTININGKLRAEVGG